MDFPEFIAFGYIIVIITSIAGAVGFGFLLGVSTIEPDEYLIEKTQEQFWEIQDLTAERNGYKQLYETANAGVCTREYVVGRLENGN